MRNNGRISRSVGAVFLSLALLLSACGAQQGESAASGTDTGASASDTAPIQEVDSVTMPLTGTAEALVVVVDFQDVTYTDDLLTTSQLEDILFGAGDADCAPCESVSAFFQRASYGQLTVEGSVYRYTASHDISYYETDTGYEELVTEVLEGLDSEIDYSTYDADGDGYLDALCISVPSGGDADFWYGNTSTWYGDEPAGLDGEQVAHYIINDEQPYADEMERYLSTITHEMGHCMGLPDYYSYSAGDSDWQATTGEAGIERMDEAEGDFCPGSKLLLGWYTEEQIQKYDLDGDAAQTFTLSDDSESGSCLILPKEDGDGYLSEYFVIDYVTASGNNAGLFADGGVRIYHVDYETETDADGNTYLRYDAAMSDAAGGKLLSLVNDGNGFYTQGDQVDASASGFGWYDSDGQAVTDTGYTVTVDSIDTEQHTCTITVTKS